MPILPMINLPRPESSRDFEYLLREYSAETFNGLAQLYGRQGQKQNGVDIVVTRPDGTRVCVQCKNYRDTNITVTDIDNWVAELNKVKFDISEFVLATSLPKPDANLQEHVYQISDSRVKEGLYPIVIIFWNDIEHFVLKHFDIFKHYWPQFAVGLMETVVENDLALSNSALEIQSGYELRNLFIKLHDEYKIDKYLYQDPFIGFEFEQLLKVDSFMDALQGLLDRAISITNTACYKQIMAFVAAFDNYNNYQSEICGIGRNGKIKFLRPFEEYNISTYKEELDSLKMRVLQRLADIRNS